MHVNVHIRQDNDSLARSKAHLELKKILHNNHTVISHKSIQFHSKTQDRKKKSFPKKNPAFLTRQEGLTFGIERMPPGLSPSRLPCVRISNTQSFSSTTNSLVFEQSIRRPQIY